MNTLYNYDNYNLKRFLRLINYKSDVFSEMYESTIAYNPLQLISDIDVRCFEDTKTYATYPV